MPAFEEFDVDDVAAFFLGWDTTDTVTTPDFSGERVDSYIRWKNLSKYLGYIKRAFPSMDDEKASSFAQCPDAFNQTILKSFCSKCHSDDTKAMFDKAMSFQKQVVLKWNPTADDPTLSAYLGLLGIDEAASKECGSLVLDTSSLWHSCRT